VVLHYNNRIIDGIARLRAQAMGCKPYLLTVWDYNLPSLPGSVADFIDHWGDPARLRMIDLDDLREAAGMSVDPVVPMPPLRAPPSSNYPSRVVRTMLFADIVGYSRLREADLPAFWRYMEKLATFLESHASRPALIESWGDALYVVHESAREAADYALAVAHAFATIDGTAYGLAEPLNVRIGLHAGPVFSGVHPLTGNGIIYGSQVNLAARIEPISRPGNIYASEQFVAALIASESLREGKREDSESLASDYTFEYLGTQELAKNYGRHAVYLLRAVPGSHALTQ
jgi:class 3 adenylate cyclase